MKLAIPLAASCLLLACSENADTDTDVDADVTDSDSQSDIDTDIDTDTDLPPLELTDVIPAGRVVAGVATSPEALLTGPKAEGLPGDFVLKNSTAAFVVEGKRISGGYRQWGGHLVDAAFIDNGVPRPDRFGEVWFGFNLRVFEPTSAELISDGSNGRAHVRLTGSTKPYAWPDSFITNGLNPDRSELEVQYDYILEPDSTSLKFVITLSNPHPNRVSVDYPMSIMNMGDGVKSFAPKVGFEGVGGQQQMKWFGALGYESAYMISADSGQTLDGLFSYANMDLMMMPSFNLASGESRVFEFSYHVSGNGTDAIVKHQASTTHTLKGNVAGLTPRFTGRGDEIAKPAWIAATSESGQVIAIAPLATDGSFSLQVDQFPLKLQAWASGQGGSNVLTLTEASTSLTLSMTAPAQLKLTTVDENDQFIPAQVTLFAIDGTNSPFAPANVRMEASYSQNRSAIAHVVAPNTELQVPPGRYRIVASRGYAYEIDERTLDLTSGSPVELSFKVERAIDTTGWLAADMHLHGRWSSDSDVSYDLRVRQAASNDIALPMLTEHAYVGNLLTATTEAGVDEWVTPIPAQEVTTFEYGHFNAFPLVYDPALPSGGGVFEHGYTGAGLFDAIRAQQPDDVIIQVNHPRSGSLAFSYFNYANLNSLTGEMNSPRASTNWDMIEAFNGRCLDGDLRDPSVRTQNVVALRDWINLTNLGWKKTLSSGSDSHDEDDGMGHPRSWIKLEQTALETNNQAIVNPLKNRQTFVSCGPFVRFSASDGTEMGGMTTADQDGEVTFAVEVWAPTWMGVTTVNLWENGQVVDTVTFSDAHRGSDSTTPAKRFDGVLRAQPTKDSWYAVEVLGSGNLSPTHFNDKPYALTNPIEVDFDRDGQWTPPGNN